MDENIKDFFRKVDSGEIEIYNEFSLQHELGIFLREIPKFKNKKIQFERNVSKFNLDKTEFVKKEIDISIFNKDMDNLSCVMELKYPKNGQYPESMFSFCKDIEFLEQLVKAGFKTGYFIAVADLPLFYSGGKSTKPIYGLFRQEQPITGRILKPTGVGGKPITISGKYVAKWNTISGDMKYCIIKVGQWP